MFVRDENSSKENKGPNKRIYMSVSCEYLCSWVVWVGRALFGAFDSIVWSLHQSITIWLWKTPVGHRELE